MGYRLRLQRHRWIGSSLGCLGSVHLTKKFRKVQEKKVKKVCEINLDPCKAMGNGSVAGCVSTGSKNCLPNGRCKERTTSYPSNDTLFPSGDFPSLKLPTVVTHETSLMARCQRFYAYAHAHDYHINSISNNSDGETFISADDPQINLWSLEISSQSFNIFDVKPANMEDLTGSTREN